MNKKKFLVIGLLGLFMISMFAGIVSAAEEESGVGGADEFFTSLWDGVKSVSFIEGGSETAGIISKIMLMALVMLLVYSVVDSFGPLKGKSKDGLRWGVAGIVGVLSFMFVSIANIQAILGTYEALGVTMTTVIPFAILIYFAFKMAEDHPAYSFVIMSPIFILFGVYLLFRWIYLPDTTPLKWIYLLTLILIVIWLIFGKRVQKAMAKAKKEDEGEKAKETVVDAVAGASELKSVHKGFAKITDNQSNEFD